MARDLYQRNLRVRRNPKRNKWAWVTVEERRVLMHNMDEAHLLNAMRMVDRRLISRRGREAFYVTMIPRLEKQLACLRRTLEKKRTQARVDGVVADAQNRARTQTPNIETI
jgi:hypothetical protein